MIIVWQIVTYVLCAGVLTCVGLLLYLAGRVRLLLARQDHEMRMATQRHAEIADDLADLAKGMRLDAEQRETASEERHTAVMQAVTAPNP